MSLWTLITSPDPRVDRVDEAERLAPFHPPAVSEREPRPRWAPLRQPRKRRLHQALAAYLVVQILFQSGLAPRTAEELHLHHSAFSNLGLLRRVLGLLSSCDCSERPDILALFSQAWKRLLEDERRADQIEARWVAAPLHAIRCMLESHPEGDDYSLGYYLSGAAGDDWFPVPFLLIVHELYEEWVRKGSQATLGRWRHLIEEELLEDPWAQLSVHELGELVELPDRPRGW